MQKWLGDDYIKSNNIITKSVPIVNPHGSLDEDPEDGIKEKQEIVISTRTLPKEEWIKTRLYASVSEFFFNKILQIPIMIKSNLEKQTYRSIFEDLISLNGNKNFPIISKVISNLKKHATSITNGGYEFILEKDCLGIFWPPGELEYIKLLKDGGSFKSFFDEAKNFLLKVKIT